MLKKVIERARRKHNQWDSNEKGWVNISRSCVDIKNIRKYATNGAIKHPYSYWSLQFQWKTLSPKQKISLIRQQSQSSAEDHCGNSKNARDYRKEYKQDKGSRVRKDKAIGHYIKKRRAPSLSNSIKRHNHWAVLTGSLDNVKRPRSLRRTLGE